MKISVVTLVGSSILGFVAGVGVYVIAIASWGSNDPTGSVLVRMALWGAMGLILALAGRLAVGGRGPRRQFIAGSVPDFKNRLSTGRGFKDASLDGQPFAPWRKYCGRTN